MGRTTVVTKNSDGIKVRMDFTGIKWPEVPRKFDKTMAELIEKHIMSEQYWLKKWEEDDSAINQYRKEVAYHNRKEVWPFHTKGVIGSGMAAKVAKEEIYKLYCEARARGDVKTTDEYLRKYTNKLTKKEGMEFLVGAFANPEYTSSEREKVGELVTARSIAIDTRKAEKLAKS